MNDRDARAAAGKAENWAPYEDLLERANFDGFAYADGTDSFWRTNAREQLSEVVEAAQL